MVNAGGLFVTRQVEGQNGASNQDSPTLDFGVGTYAGKLTATIYWGDGTVQTLTNVTPDQIMTVHETTSSLLGDLNHDGFVGQADLNIVLSHWGQHVSGPANGDPTNEGFVGQDDLNVILSQWGQGTAPAVAFAAVPEPSTCVLLAIAGVMGLAGFWRKRRELA